MAGLEALLATALEGGDLTELVAGFFVAAVEAGGFLGGISRIYLDRAVDGFINGHFVPFTEGFEVGRQLPWK